MSDPLVSVIVPVRNRRDLLIELLDALAKQTFRDFETIVVDDGSSDGADLVVLNRMQQDKSLRLVRAGGVGAVSARRLGTAEATGQVLAFTDSDCVPDPMWLEAGVTAIQTGAGMVNGLTLPARSMRPLERSVSSGQEGLYPTCNMFFKRDVFERMGGFDETAVNRLRFRVDRRAKGLGFGEDTILAWNIIRAGIETRYVPEAYVEHHVFPASLAEWASRGMQMAAFPALVREVPELRRTLLRRRIYLPPRNRFPIYALAVSVIGGRRRIARLIFTWWVLETVRQLKHEDGEWPEKLAWLPAEMGLDLLFAGALVAGSVRTRTVVI